MSARGITYGSVTQNENVCWYIPTDYLLAADSQADYDRYHPVFEQVVACSSFTLDFQYVNLVYGDKIREVVHSGLLQESYQYIMSDSIGWLTDYYKTTESDAGSWSGGWSDVINEVNTEVVNNVVNDITNNNVNMVEAISVAHAAAQANAEAQAPTDVNVESPTINVTLPEVKVEPPVVNVEVPQPTSAAPFADISDVDTTIGGESYLDTIAAHEQARKKRESDKVNAIMAYLKVAMPPFMPKDQVERLCQEVLEWIKDPEYFPTEGVHVYREFSTLDARHLICNISERLGKNYIGHNRSQFIKALFAETCQQLEEPAIYKNIKERPLEGHIKYDKPDEGSIAFHYELLEQSI